MSILPEGENLRNAVKWIAEERLSAPGKNLATLIDDASRRFDLSPGDSEFLCRFVMEEQKKKGG